MKKGVSEMNGKENSGKTGIKKMDVRADRADEALEAIEEDMLAGWRIIGERRLGYYSCDSCRLCPECGDCDFCEPVLTLIIRAIHKPGERLVLYAAGKRVVEGDQEVVLFLMQRKIPVPKVIGDE
jgi:hypothetical protein